MCDELTEKDGKQFLLNGGKINRRDFSKIGAAALLTAMLPKIVFAETVIEATVEISTSENTLIYQKSFTVKNRTNLQKYVR